MELFIADKNRNELGVVQSMNSFDCEISSEPEVERNTFELVVPMQEWQRFEARRGFLVYVPDTAYGGIIDKFTSNGKTVTLSGATWEGILARQMARTTASASGVITPDSTGQMTVNGNSQAVLSALILSDLYELEESTIDVNGYYRYETVLTVIRELSNYKKLYGLRLAVEYSAIEKKVLIKLVPCRNYANEIDLSSDYGARITYIEDDLSAYNHIHVLGSGQLTNRIRADVWRTTDGGFTSLESNPNRILDGRTYIYDYNTLDTLDAAKDAGKKKLIDLAMKTEVKINIPPSTLDLELADIVSAVDHDIGVESVAVIDKKILRMTSRTARVEYQASSKVNDLYFEKAKG